MPPLGRLGGIALSSTLSRILCSSASGRRKEMVLVEWWWVNSLHWWVSWVIKVPPQYPLRVITVSQYPLPSGCCGLSTPLVGSVIHSTPVVGYRPNGAAAGHLLAYWSLGKEGERERAIKLNDNTQHSTTLDNHLSNHQNQLESIREHE